MTTEVPTRLDPESERIAREEAARARNLQEGADVRVPKGDEASPGERLNPHDARKALFAKRRDVHADQRARDAESHPSMAELEGAVGRDINTNTRRTELDRSSHIDTEAPGRGAKPEVKAPLDKAGGKVKVRVNGQDFEVPAADVERAGGVEAYQKRRAAAIALTEASKERESLARERADLLRMKNELEELRRSGGASPATPAPAAGGTAATQQGAAGGSGDVQADAARLVKVLFSGAKQEDIIKTVAEVLSSRTTPVDANAVAQRAAEILKQAPTARPEPARDPYALSAPDIDSINATMSGEYADIIKDPGLKKLALDHFERIRRAPENVGRDVADVAREAGDHVRERYGANPRTAVLERKRETLPPPPTGGARAVEEAPVPLAPRGSDYVAELRRRAGRT